MEESIKRIIKDALRRCKVEFDEGMEIEVTSPKVASHGDLTTNIALVLSKSAGVSPRDLAKRIADNIADDEHELARVEVAGPGFINFTIDPNFYLRRLGDVYKSGKGYGRSNVGGGRKLQVEFVSANPTGPLHIGHGRGAVYGDVLASILGEVGYEVSREYYVNDVGGQIKTLGRSVHCRFRELEGEPVEFPENGYKGHYIVDLAKELRSKSRDKIISMREDDAIEFCGDYAADKILNDIKKDLAETGIVHDIYFHENLLHSDAMVESAISWLKGKGHIYEQEGAIWFKSIPFGDDKDRVLRKGDGSYTYFASDIAYHKNKFDRGFDRVIDIWGADHGGYVARMKAAVQALGRDPSAFDPVLIQLVNLVKGGDAVSMSTRSATYETLEDVRREVGRDVCRYFFLMRSHNAQLDFDLDLAKKETPDNPVFYIQYAHARIASIFRKAAEKGLSTPGPDKADLSALSLPEEPRLARFVLAYPGVIRECAEFLEPHKLAFYLLELSRMFQSYYSQGRRDDRYRVVADDRRRSEAKLYLLKNIQIVLQNGLRVLGISAPDVMERDDAEAED